MEILGSANSASAGLVTLATVDSCHSTTVGFGLAGNIAIKDLKWIFKYEKQKLKIHLPSQSC
jgi:hypothetical protein